MKVIYEWLLTIRDQRLKKRALTYFKQSFNPGNKAVKVGRQWGNIQHAGDQAFSWTNTTEGFDFWRDFWRNPENFIQENRIQPSLVTGSVGTMEAVNASEFFTIQPNPIPREREYFIPTNVVRTREAGAAEFSEALSNEQSDEPVASVQAIRAFEDMWEEEQSRDIWGSISPLEL